MIGEKPKKLTERTKPFFLVFTLGLFLMSLTHTAQAIPNGGYAYPEIIIQPEELKFLVEKKDPNIRIIDVRENLQYLRGHVPGAVQVWRPDIEDKDHPIPGMMAPQPQIEALLGNLGINENNTQVVYSDLYDHARLWWILAYYGFPLDQMKLLDGGIDAWKAKGYPVELIPAPVEKKRFKLQGETKGRKPLLCTLPEVKSALKKTNQVVLDVRTKKEYASEERKKALEAYGVSLIFTDPLMGSDGALLEAKRMYETTPIATSKGTSIITHPTGRPTTKQQDWRFCIRARGE